MGRHPVPHAILSEKQRVKTRHCRISVQTSSTYKLEIFGFYSQLLIFC